MRKLLHLGTQLVRGTYSLNFLCRKTGSSQHFNQPVPAHNTKPSEGKLSPLCGLWQCLWVPLLVYMRPRVAVRGDRNCAGQRGTALQDLPGHKSSAEEQGEQRGIFGKCLGLTCQYYTFRRMA